MRQTSTLSFQRHSITDCLFILMYGLHSWSHWFSWSSRECSSLLKAKCELLYMSRVGSVVTTAEGNLLEILCIWQAICQSQHTFYFLFNWNVFILFHIILSLQENCSVFSGLLNSMWIYFHLSVFPWVEVSQEWNYKPVELAQGSDRARFHFSLLSTFLKLNCFQYLVRVLQSIWYFS